MLDIIERLYRAQELEMRVKKPSSKDAALIEELRAEIPAPILAHYDRLRSRGKKGVSVIRNNVCSGCHMGVAIGTIVTLKKGKDIQLCGSCGRYLYLPPEEAAVPEPPVPEAKPKRKRRSAKPIPDAS